MKINKVLRAGLVILGVAFSHAGYAKAECDLPDKAFTSEQAKRFSVVLGSGLRKFTKAYETQFNRSKPNRYRDFAEFKVSFRGTVSGLEDLANCGWSKGGRFANPDHEGFKNVVNGFTDLNILTIDMQRYLKDGKASKLKSVESKLAELYALTEPYKNYKPKK